MVKTISGPNHVFLHRGFAGAAMFRHAGACGNTDSCEYVFTQTHLAIIALIHFALRFTAVGAMDMLPQAEWETAGLRPLYCVHEPQSDGSKIRFWRTEAQSDGSICQQAPALDLKVRRAM